VNRSSGIVVAASTAATAPWLVAPAAATPMSSLTGLHKTVTPPVDTAQYRRGGDRGLGIGGVGLGLAAGAQIGGATIGATRPYGRYGYEDSDPGCDQDYISVPLRARQRNCLLSAALQILRPGLRHLPRLRRPAPSMAVRRLKGK